MVAEEIELWNFLSPESYSEYYDEDGLLNEFKMMWVVFVSVSLLCQLERCVPSSETLHVRFYMYMCGCTSSLSLCSLVAFRTDRTSSAPRGGRQSNARRPSLLPQIG